MFWRLKVKLLFSILKPPVVNNVPFYFGVSLCGSVVKNPPANAGDAGHAGLIPGSGRSPGEGNGCPLQYSCLGKPMDRGTWRATFMGPQRAGHDLVTKRQQFGFSSNSNSGLVLQVLVRRSPHWHSPWGVRRGHQTLLQDSPGAPCTSLTQVHIGCFLKGGGTWSKSL